MMYGNIKKLLVLILIFILLLFINCSYKTREDFYKNLNKLGEELSLLISNFNNLKFGDSKNDMINILEKVRKDYNIVLKKFFTYKRFLKKETITYFNTDYILSFESFINSFYDMFNKENISETQFIEKYNECGKKLNDFIRTHNSFLNILDNR